MHHLLLSKQDSFGLKSWTSFALEASVGDTIAFVECVMQDASSFPGILRDRALGDELGVHSTPTVIIEGWRMPRPPTYAELLAMVEARKEGRDIVRAR
jgi:protein-disulfide isomerase